MHIAPGVVDLQAGKNRDVVRENYRLFWFESAVSPMAWVLSACSTACHAILEAAKSGAGRSSFTRDS